MEKTGKWSVKDVITTVLLSVLMVVLQLGINMVCMMNHFVSMVLSVGISCLVCAPIYFLLVRRVRKHFVSAIYMFILAIVFLLMGDWFVSVWFIVPAVIMELILWKPGACEKAGRITAAWTVYSACYIGVNLLPIWFLWGTYEQHALASGMAPDYLQSFLGYYQNPVWLVVILAINVGCGLLGSLIGSKLTSRHFKKAGVL